MQSTNNADPGDQAPRMIGGDHQRPIVKATETDRAIWRCTRPRKTGGNLRWGSVRSPGTLFGCCFGPRDKANPGHWNCKMKGGPRAEWWAYMMEGSHRILDVGCGFGFPSFYLASCGHDVIGVDASCSEIAIAERYRREEGPSYHLKYQVIEQTKLPFEAGSFDGATIGSALECFGDAEAMMSEVTRVLKPGAPVAIEEEDRATAPATHPVWEKLFVTVIDAVPYLHVETRICDPYVDRRYMIRLKQDGQVAGRFRTVGEPDDPGWGVPLKEAGFVFERVLDEAVDAEYGEAKGYDAHTLRDFLQAQDFRHLQFWACPNGRQFAQHLQATGVIDAMPDDIQAVSRALVRSVSPLTNPSTLVSCRTAGERGR